MSQFDSWPIWPTTGRPMYFGPDGSPLDLGGSRATQQEEHLG